MHVSTQNNPGRGVRLILGLALAAVMLGACASAPSTPPAAASIEAARQAIATAERSDARQFAGAELDEARQRLGQAERAATAENATMAERFAQQSRVSAELALARTELAKAEEINREMRRSADALRDELRRTGGQP
ncbi:MAG: DUF4398 domain-containing protein [Wenzhouxiangella sp.]